MATSTAPDTGGGDTPSPADGAGNAEFEESGRRRWGTLRRLRLGRTDAAILLVPILIGAVTGWFATSGPTPAYRATVLVNAGPGVTTTEALSISPEVADRSVQTELVFIDTETEAMATAMASAAGVTDPPPVVATQVGATNVVAFAVTYPDAEAATTMANAAADVYISGWRTRAGQDSRRQLTALDDALTIIRERITAVPEGPTQGAELDALNSQFQTLSVRRAETALALANIDTSQRIVQAATDANTVRVSSPIRGALLGAVLGLLVGVALLLWRHQRRAGAPTDAPEA